MILGKINMVQVEDLVASAGDRGGRRRRNVFLLTPHMEATK